MTVIATQRLSIDLSLDTKAQSHSSMVMSSTPTSTTTTPIKANATTLKTYPNRAVGVWSSKEHDRFLEALKKYPQGPWKMITKFVGTRSVRQVQTHAQKYQEKVSRRLHGMQTGKVIRLRREHRIDHEILAQHTLISFSSELRNKYARPTHHEAKLVSVSRSSGAVMNVPAQGKMLQLPCPTIDPPLVFDGNRFCPSMENNRASPSSVSSSSFIFDDAVFAVMKMDDLPTLSESLDFFIESFS